MRAAVVTRPQPCPRPTVKNTDCLAPPLPVPAPDPRTQALARVFERWRAGHGPALAQGSLERLQAALQERLGDDEDPPPARNPLERLEIECLLALLQAESLGAHTLAVVHCVFAAARGTPDG